MAYGNSPKAPPSSGNKFSPALQMSGAATEEDYQQMLMEMMAGQQQPMQPPAMAPPAQQQPRGQQQPMTAQQQPVPYAAGSAGQLPQMPQGPATQKRGADTTGSDGKGVTAKEALGKIHNNRKKPIRGMY